MSSIPATAIVGNSPVTLNMTDTDSSMIDPSGDLVVASQQDSEIVYIKNIEAPNAVDQRAERDALWQSVAA